ncbi:MAG: hypothetical protein ACI9C4_001019 [Paraglaciecola sp.]
MFTVFLLFITTSVYCYVQAFKSALWAKKWALMGLVAGPAILPLFTVHKRMALRRARGPHCSLFLA